MAIKVKFFANLREKTGKAEDTVEYTDGITTSQIWAQATDHLEMPEGVMIAVNMDYVKGDPIVSDNNEVAFFPQVTGG